MDINHQQFEKIYEEYINDYNLLLIMFHKHYDLKDYIIDKQDIQYFISLFKEEYKEYQHDIMNSFKLFQQNYQYLIAHTKSGLYYLNSNNYLDDIQDILNHYNQIYNVLEKYEQYLQAKYQKPEISNKNKKVYRHVRKLI